ncbi:MAG: response regulator [Anaerolineae bacterium]
MMAKPLILIVEDDEATAECLSDLFTDEGYATQALSSPGTLEAVRSAKPDLILLDLVFPNSKGEDLLRAVRLDRELEHLPVVLLSAVPRLADMAARLPVQGYVPKPFELDLLLDTVNNLVGRPCYTPSSDHCWA